MEVDAYSLLQMHKTRRSFDSSRASPAPSPSPKKKPKTPKLTRIRSMRTPSVTSIFSSMSDPTRNNSSASSEQSVSQSKSKVPTPSIASSQSSTSVSTNGSYVSKHVLNRDNSAGSSVAERRFQFESSGPPSPSSRSRGHSNNSTPSLNRGDSWGTSSTGSGSKFPPRTFVFQPTSQPPTPTTTGPSNTSSSFPSFGSAPQRSYSFEPKTRPSTVRSASESKLRPLSPSISFGSESNTPLPTPRSTSANNSRPSAPTKPLHASPNVNSKTLSPIQGSPDIKPYSTFGASNRRNRDGAGEQVGLGILNVEDSEDEFEFDDISSCIGEATERFRPLSVAESTSTLARGITENDILDSYIADRKRAAPAAEVEEPVYHRRTPIPAGIDNIKLIEQLLESNYRGQAETFNNASSRSSSLRSLSRSTSASASSPLARPTPSRSATLGVTSTSPASEGSYETPTRSTPSFAASQRSASIGNSLNKGNRTPSGRIILEPYQIKSPAPTTPQSYGHRVYQVPSNDSPTVVKRSKRNISTTRDRLIYFTEEEILAIQAVVDRRQEGYGCDKHENCTDCREIEYSKLENQAMPTSMPPEERQKIINNNRSLRNIKNELENLAENGCIDDNVYDQIMSILPSESSLNASARSNAAPSPAPAPTAALNNMRINNDPPPPAYSTPTPPSLPNRSTPSKPEIARATALYRYTEPEDCNFEVGDQISVYEYMNADWWLGKNVRTGKEGVFPVNYVQVQANHAAPTTPASHYNNEKVNNNGYPGMAQPQSQSQGPPPPGPSNPYNSSVPPMAVAQGSGEQKQPGKGGEMGKKFGKKLGNAAIFGAGATIGGNIVNSIF